MEEMKSKTETVESEKKKIEAKLKEVRERVKKEEEAGGDNLAELKKSLGDIEKQALTVRKKEQEGPQNCIFDPRNNIMPENWL